MTLTPRIASCACGQVKFQALGDPILTAVCYCDDCQDGGKMLAALPNAPAALDPDGGSSYLTLRDDRWTCVQGRDLLKGYSLKDTSPTQRYVATCCNTAMFLKYKRGHWVSTFRNRYTDTNLPAIEMRTNTRFRPNGTPIPTDAPTYRRFPLKLFGKLIAARIDMALGR